jgi:hypothetical protein
MQHIKIAIANNSLQSKLLMAIALNQRIAMEFISQKARSIEMQAANESPMKNAEK